jgi:thioredoxin reductase (NADPH)
LSLTQYCSKVYVVRRSDRFRARPHFVEKVQNHPAIEVLDNTVVTRIEGNGGVEEVRIRTPHDGSERGLRCAGVFPFIGLAPNAAFVPPAVARDESGYLVTDDALESAVRGLWAIGAVRHGYGGLLSDAIREAGAVANSVVARLR